MFQRDSNGIVETVVLLSKGEVDSKKIRVEFSLEDMDMSEFQDGIFTYRAICVLQLILLILTDKLFMPMTPMENLML